MMISFLFLLMTVCSAMNFIPPTFLGKLETAVSEADLDAFKAAFLLHPPHERVYHGHSLWTIFIEERLTKHRLRVRYLNYRVPEDYALNRQIILRLLHRLNLIATDVSSNGRSVLQAVMENNWEVLEFLVNSGYQVDVHDARGDTPLSWAIRNGYFRCARILLPFADDSMLSYVQTYHPGFGRNLLQLLEEDAPYLPDEFEDRRYVRNHLNGISEGFDETKGDE